MKTISYEVSDEEYGKAAAVAAARAARLNAQYEYINDWIRARPITPKEQLEYWGAIGTMNQAEELQAYMFAGTL